MRPNVENARAGLFRALDADEAAKFLRAGSTAYENAMREAGQFVISPVHHPRFREGALLAALEHVEAELAVIAETRSVENDRVTL